METSLPLLLTAYDDFVSAQVIILCYILSFNAFFIH
jgi:hypothetical protein